MLCAVLCRSLFLSTLTRRGEKKKKKKKKELCAADASCVQRVSRTAASAEDQNFTAVRLSRFSACACLLLVRLLLLCACVLSVRILQRSTLSAQTRLMQKPTLYKLVIDCCDIPRSCCRDPCEEEALCISQL